MNTNKNNFFFKLGSALATASVDPTLDPNYILKQKEVALYDSNHINAYKKLASICSSLINNYSEDGNKEKHVYHLNKIASLNAEEWNDHCDDVLNNCWKKIAAAAAFKPLLIKSLGVPLGLGSSAAGSSIPITGVLGGGLSWMAEKELAEDDLKTEMIKNNIREYQKLTAELDAEIEKYYRNKKDKESEDNESE